MEAQDPWREQGERRPKASLALVVARLGCRRGQVRDQKQLLELEQGREQGREQGQALGRQELVLAQQSEEEVQEQEEQEQEPKTEPEPELEVQEPL